MARPERMRNRSDVGFMSVIVLKEPATKTMIHEKTRTTMVRKAVARSESVFLMPHLARIDVSPAKTAERTAVMIQNINVFTLRLIANNCAFIIMQNLPFFNRKSNEKPMRNHKILHRLSINTQSILVLFICQTSPPTIVFPLRRRRFSIPQHRLFFHIYKRLLCTVPDFYHNARCQNGTHIYPNGGSCEHRKY